jgi:hypothetical protein
MRYAGSGAVNATVRVLNGAGCYNTVAEYQAAGLARGEIVLVQDNSACDLFERAYAAEQVLSRLILSLLSFYDTAAARF